MPMGRRLTGADEPRHPPRTFELTRICNATMGNEEVHSRVDFMCP